MTIDPAILAAFGPPPPTVDLTETDVAVNNGAVIALLSLAVVAVVLRFTVRIILQNPLMADDWVIIGGLISIGGSTGLSIAGGAVGAGRHVWAVSLDDLMSLYTLLFSYTFVYASACTCTRLSILFFYRRIFSPLESWLKVAILAGGFLTLSYPLIVWITMANVCRPVSFFWTQFSGTTKGECINANMFFLAAGILNMINDFLILLIPFPRIIKLQMSKKKKAAICAIMAVGMFVCIASILRIHFLSIFMTSIDVTFLMGPVFIWSSIEPSVAIVCACLPHLSPLARLAHRSIASSFHSKRSKYASGPGTGAGASVQGRSRRGTLGERGGKFDGYAGGLGQRRKNADASEDEISLTNYSGRT